MVAELFKDVLNQAEILPVIFDLTVHFRGISNRENNTESKYTLTFFPAPLFFSVLFPITNASLV